MTGFCFYMEQNFLKIYLPTSTSQISSKNLPRRFDSQGLSVLNRNTVPLKEQSVNENVLVSLAWKSEIELKV